jgi:hypothetical protein
MQDLRNTVIASVKIIHVTVEPLKRNVVVLSVSNAEKARLLICKIADAYWKPQFLRISPVPLVPSARVESVMTSTNAMKPILMTI